MGHFHAKNLSKILFRLFWTEYLENKKDEHGDVVVRTGKRKQPDPIPLTKLVEYFASRIKAVQQVIDPLPDSWGKKLIAGLMESEWGTNASEGAYTDDGMLEDGIINIIDVWQDPKNWNGIQVIKGDKTGYYLSQDAFDHTMKPDIEMSCFLIDEIEL